LDRYSEVLSDRYLAIDEVGLTSALRFYVEGFSKRSKIEVDLELQEHASKLSKAQELVVFRVVQESLTSA
jgi:signal transduction histidine kinase